MGASASMWLVDSHGLDIKGESRIYGRENSIELRSIDHSIHAPFDPHTGQNTSPRIHAPFTIIKKIDNSTPVLNKACCNGEKFKDITICLYRVNNLGKEELYFKYKFENVKITSIAPLIHCSMGEEDNETVSFIYQKIKWEYMDGNHAHEDEWNAR